MGNKDKETRERAFKRQEGSADRTDLPLLSRSGNHNPSRCCSVLAACNIPSKGRVVVGAWPLVLRSSTRFRTHRDAMCATFDGDEVADQPSRGRTYGPLIKSEARGVAQVIDSLGNPLVIGMRYAVAEYSQLVSTCRYSPGFAALPNTVLTPEGGLYT